MCRIVASDVIRGGVNIRLAISRHNQCSTQGGKFNGVGLHDTGAAKPTQGCTNSAATARQRAAWFSSAIRL